ncbi:hypothetical protein B0H14DRAFT_2713155 [Mycena olivaceomarginata]|nr:hypothetical protein B0H14DRAFT_2713155 [Mycena olivaceomarginata]
MSRYLALWTVLDSFVGSPTHFESFSPPHIISLPLLRSLCAHVSSLGWCTLCYFLGDNSHGCAHVSFFTLFTARHDTFPTVLNYRVGPLILSTFFCSYCFQLHSLWSRCQILILLFFTTAMTCPM